MLFTSARLTAFFGASKFLKHSSAQIANVKNPHFGLKPKYYFKISVRNFQFIYFQISISNLINSQLSTFCFY